METWFETSACEIFISDLVGAEEFFFCLILDGNGGNEVGVVDIENDKICVATIGREWELPSLVGEYLSTDVMDDHEDEIGGFFVDGNCWYIIVVVVDIVDDGDGWIAERGGSLALAGLIHVSFFGCIVDCDVAAHPG